MVVAFFALIAVVFALLASYFSYREEKRVSEMKKQEKELQRKLYESNLLREITEKIGYSLKIEGVAETIALTVQNLFDLSTVSYAIKGEDKTLFVKTFLKEKVSAPYFQQVSKIIISAMGTIDPALSDYKIVENTNESVLQSYIDTQFDTVSAPVKSGSIGVDILPLSYFNIPLVIQNQLVGMINISSRKKGIYQDADMSLLYKIINTAQRVIGELNNVIETEEEKLNSMILSFPSGGILFGFEEGQGQDQPSGFSLSVINQAAKNFLRLDPDLIDTPNMAQVISRFPPELKIADKIRDSITDKKSIILRDIDIFDKHFTLFVTPVFMHNSQKIIGVSIIMRDLTPQRKLEEVRENFTNMLVHELRAPVTAIRGASSLLLSESLPQSEQEKMMHVISDSARDMLSTISELLDVARLETGKFPLRKVKSDFAVIVREHAEVFSYAARERNIGMNLDIEDGLPPFFFDPGRIGQVINNLLSNSIKFTKEGGRINLKIAGKDGQIEVEVSDNGIGIPTDKKAFLFTKFGQIREGFETGTGLAKSIRGGEGSGLGLFISKEIIESHGGKIWIESEEGKGTRVKFTLPVVLEEPKRENELVQKFAN